MPIRGDHRIQLLVLGGSQRRLADGRRCQTSHRRDQVLNRTVGQNMPIGGLERPDVVAAIDLLTCH